MSYIHCADLIKKHDYENYVMILCMPTKARNALFALYAFHHEIAKTRFIVTEATMGMIRLQWWRDAVKTIISDVPLNHEVVRALHQANREGAGWTEQDFIALIDAHEDFFVMQQWPDDTAMWRFIETSSPALGIMAVRVLHEQWSDDTQKIATASAMLAYLKAVPYDLKNGRAVFSATQTASIENDLGKKEVLISFVPPILNKVQSLLDHTQPSKKNRFASVMKTAALLRLQRLQKVNGDVFHARFQNTDPLWPLYIWGHQRRLFRFIARHLDAKRMGGFLK